MSGRAAEGMAVLMSAIGVAHAGATFVFFDALTAEALWHASGGLAMLLVGFLNLAHLRSPEAPLLWPMTLIANGAAFVLMVLLGVGAGELPAFAWLVLLAAATVGALRARRRPPGARRAH